MPWKNLDEDLAAEFQAESPFDPWHLSVHDSLFTRGEDREQARERNRARYKPRGRVVKKEKTREQIQARAASKAAWEKANREKRTKAKAELRKAAS